tara:strand:- start:359 stop:835 length:477 start_codon:yes stop_codon:yes gene_type:complete
MATTVASFSAIDDTAIDAESPIVESMVKQMRDNSYWIDAGTRKTTETDTKKTLKPDGSGGVAWATGGVNGTKGAGTIGTTSGSPTSVSIISGLVLHFLWGTNTYFIDASDDTYANAINGTTGTITGTFADIGSGFYVRKNGSAYEFYAPSNTYGYIWL